MDTDKPAGPTVRDWAEATLKVTKVERAGSPQIFELRKQMVVNGVLHEQFVWLTHSQLRSVGIDHGL